MDHFFYLTTILPYYNTGFSPSESVIGGLLFCGAMGLLTLFTASFHLINKSSKIYLYYGLFVLFSFSGGVINLQYDMALSEDPREMKSIASLLLEDVTLLAFSAYSLFTIRLLDLKNKNKGLFRWVSAMAYATLIYTIIYTIIYRWIAEYEGLYFMVSRVIILLMSLTALIGLIIKIKSPVKSIFIIGSLFYLLGALIASIIQLVPNLPFESLYNLRSTIYFEGGLLLESFCFGLAISYQVYLLNKSQQKEEEHLRIQAEYEKSLAQAEMLATRMQVNPHFIFNNLGAINLLIQKQENKKASQYLITFSRFIRMILELPKSQTITLKEEIKLIRYYLSLEGKRFDENFRFSINKATSYEVDNILIPPLLLQPFVENAIWHGLLPSPYKDKEIKIDIHKNASSIEIIIEDNGVGISHQKEAGKQPEKKSLGMKITKDRIQQFNQSFNCHIDLNIQDKHLSANSNKSSGTKVILTISGIEQLKQTEAY
ncbi:MAG TPA: histidine kinase [Chitinophagaceae bacterium]|nr:histidine kinase [Chitinophagaceae bacterium]